MTIKELIGNLETILKEHGDLEVEKYDISRNRTPVKIIEIAYKKILSKRKSKPSFWHYIDLPETKGEKIVRI